MLMNAKAIQDILRTRPFEPVYFVLSSGDRYLVRHPDNVMLMKERVEIAYYENQSQVEPDELPDRSINVSYLHVAAIEPAPRTSRPQAV
jgi:hypothetical protein